MGRKAKAKKFILSHKRIRIRLEKSKAGTKRISVAMHEKARKNGKVAEKRKHEETTIVYMKPSSGITTEIDDMLQMISERKRMKVDRMAKALDVGEEQICEWARILEERGLVKMHYPAMGKPEIMISAKSAGISH